MNSPFNLKGKYNTMAYIIVGTLVASLLISLLLIRPAWAKLTQLGREIPTETQKKDTSQSELANLEKAKKFFEENRNQAEQTNIAVPTDPQIPQVLVILEGLAKDNRVRLTSFVPQQTGSANPQTGAAGGGGATATGGAANPAGTQSVEVTANFEGSYPALISFFYALEKSLRIIDVRNITVSNASGNPTSTMTGSITFKAYYKPAPGVAK